MPFAQVNNRPPVEIPKALLKELRAYGHKIERFLAARGQWFRHANKLKADGLPSWVRGNGLAAPGELPGDGLFACRLILRGSKFLLEDLLLTQDSTANFAALWQSADPEAPRALPPLLNLPVDAKAPLWLALLRLKPLREFWDRELRRSTVASLLEALPEAWVLDPSVLPPGAVIPRLEITAWSHLPRLRNAGRAFDIVAADGAGQAVALDGGASAAEWTASLQRAQDTFSEAPQILVERFRDSAPTIVAFFEKRADRVEGLGALALVKAEDGSVLPARVIAAHAQHAD